MQLGAPIELCAIALDDNSQSHRSEGSVPSDDATFEPDSEFALSVDGADVLGDVTGEDEDLVGSVDRFVSPVDSAMSEGWSDRDDCDWAPKLGSFEGRFSDEFEVVDTVSSGAGALDPSSGLLIGPEGRRRGRRRRRLRPSEALSLFDFEGLPAPSRYCTTFSSDRARRSSKSSRPATDSTRIRWFFISMDRRVISTTRLIMTS